MGPRRDRGGNGPLVSGPYPALGMSADRPAERGAGPTGAGTGGNGSTESDLGERRSAFASGRGRLGGEAPPQERLRGARLVLGGLCLERSRRPRSGAGCNRRPPGEKDCPGVGLERPRRERGAASVWRRRQERGAPDVLRIAPITSTLGSVSKSPSPGYLTGFGDFEVHDTQIPDRSRIGWTVGGLGVYEAADSPNADRTAPPGDLATAIDANIGSTHTAVPSRPVARARRIGLFARGNRLHCRKHA